HLPPGEGYAEGGSDLDKDTLERLNHGRVIMEILKQPQYKTLSVEKEVVILYAVTNKYLDDIEVDRIQEFEVKFFDYMEKYHNNVLLSIAEKKVIDGGTEKELINAIENFKKEFN
ncbi:MAG: F0F1 ATP synthase subunit alpha, partial [Clostridia bacterium]|nr:F0F1 ATP synthase subunit alpha [Clostridia bacterium]